MTLYLLFILIFTAKLPGPATDTNCFSFVPIGRYFLIFSFLISLQHVTQLMPPSRNSFVLQLRWLELLNLFGTVLFSCNLLEVSDSSSGLSSHLFLRRSWLVPPTHGLNHPCYAAMASQVMVLGNGLGNSGQHPDVTLASRTQHIQSELILFPLNIFPLPKPGSSLSYHHQIQVGQHLLFNASESYSVLPPSLLLLGSKPSSLLPWGKTIALGLLIF